MIIRLAHLISVFVAILQRAEVPRELMFLTCTIGAKSVDTKFHTRALFLSVFALFFPLTDKQDNYYDSRFVVFIIVQHFRFILHAIVLFYSIYYLFLATSRETNRQQPRLRLLFITQDWDKHTEIDFY